MKTICKKCIHIHMVAKEEIWYNARCKAYERQQCQDPVFGKDCYLSKNDLGKTIYTDEKYPYCTNINNGSCEKYVGFI